MDTKVCFLCVFLHDCVVLFSPPHAQPWMAMQRGDRKERATDVKRARGNTGERENQPALTLRQSISSLLRLFPMGWPG